MPLPPADNLVLFLFPIIPFVTLNPLTPAETLTPDLLKLIPKPFPNFILFLKLKPI